MRNVMYEIPSRDDVEKCVVTKETVENNTDPTLVFVDPGLKRKSSRSRAERAPARQTKPPKRDRGRFFVPFPFDKGIDKGTVLLSIDNGTESWNRDLYETRHGDRALSTRATLRRF